jgi:hypothetical protein
MPPVRPTRIAGWMLRFVDFARWNPSAGAVVSGIGEILKDTFE